MARQEPQVNGLKIISGPDTVGQDGEVLVSRTADGLQISIDGGAVEPLGGIASLPGLPAYEVYADPAGDDEAAGTAAAPFRTLYAATANVIQQGGGTVWFSDNTTCGGPIDGQGLWLRNDGVAVPGFLDVGAVVSGCQLRIIGMGSQSGQFVFEAPGAARMSGGSVDTPTKPLIWVVGSEVPCEFGYVKSSVGEFDGLLSPMRLGWDYARKPDFSMEALEVTDANRADNSTVYTVNLSSATSWVITSATRSTILGIKQVNLTLTRPTTVALAPWVPGAIIRVATGGDTDFPGGDFVVNNQSDTLNLTRATTTITVQYQQDGTNMTKSIAGTVKSHGLTAGDYLLTDFANAQFPACPQMTVTANTVDTVTVFDPYGYGSRSATIQADPDGTITKQVRGRSVASGVILDRCSIFGKAGSADITYASPTLDLGGTSANALRIYRSYFSGGNAWNWPSHPDNYDPNRTMVAILADPGGGTVSGASFQAYDCQSQSGHVRWNPQQTEAAIFVDQWLQDSGSIALPTVVCGDGNDTASVRLDRIANADAAQAAIEIGTGYDGLKVQIGDVYSSAELPVISRSRIQGPRNLRSELWLHGVLPSPWAIGWNTPYPGGLTMQHKGINWSHGVLTARQANLFPPLADWQLDVPFPAGVTVTQDGLAPDGSTNALKIVNVNGGVVSITVGLYPTGTWSNGDGVIFGAWLKFPAANGVLALSDYSGGTLFDGTSSLRMTRYVSSAGYQPVMGAARLQTSGAFAGKFFIALNIPAGTSYVWNPTLLRSLAGAMVDDEFYEWGLNQKPQPLYLPAGMNGTPEGGKLVAHGGIAGPSFNDITLAASPNGIVVPYYDASGALLGYLPLYDEFTP